MIMAEGEHGQHRNSILARCQTMLVKMAEGIMVVAKMVEAGIEEGNIRQ